MGDFHVLVFDQLSRIIMRSYSLGAVQPLRVPLNPINEEESASGGGATIGNGDDWKTKFREQATSTPASRALPLICINDSPANLLLTPTSSEAQEEEDEIDIETEWKQFKERMAKQNNPRSNNDVEQFQKESALSGDDEITEWEKFKQRLTVNKNLIPLKLAM